MIERRGIGKEFSKTALNYIEIKALDKIRVRWRSFTAALCLTRRVQRCLNSDKICLTNYPGISPWKS